ncbi:putative inner membrane transporter YedA [Flavobacterium bizetiae]|uniref:Putative inner membrane transporter YedA n=1 Tax=Flavobacterium bizetiae TaxID=2704140 RepID=A0A6J4GE85_9FLAO|nr:EamA family transporter [Flavobacterium bizetiae]CAA9196340.1 putative inner membrane transporter YedA [Flavobacterium bizetiae]CAD5342826.1 putative inner membrane transporter YedA [Flavobacterium bizetiae]CAD5348535.1 putative inner membrane transporter YedA [Flavobacterium bizetiae]
MKQNLDYKLIIALSAVGIVWGTTFLGIKVAVETIPPWFVTSIRQGLAGLVMMTILLFKKELEWIGWENLKRQLVPSILMIVIANGFTTIAEQNIPSGLASVINALTPILIFLGSIMFGLQKMSIRGFVGVIIGFSGVVFIFKDGLGSFLDADYRTGVMFMGLAILAWAAGTIYTKTHVNKSNNITLNLFYQFTMASCIQLVLASIFSPNPDFNSWSSKSIFAALYLSIFGSVIAFFCYNYALKHVTAVQVSILSYINTIIAVFLGWLLLDEVITIDFVIATALIILGVFIVNYKKKEKKAL